jgi:hypothetical protein
MAAWPDAFIIGLVNPPNTAGEQVRQTPQADTSAEVWWQIAFFCLERRLNGICGFNWAKLNVFQRFRIRAHRIDKPYR